MKKYVRNSVVRFCITAACAAWLAFPAMAEERVIPGLAPGMTAPAEESAGERTEEITTGSTGKYSVDSTGTAAADSMAEAAANEEGSGASPVIVCGTDSAAKTEDPSGEDETAASADPQASETGTRGESLGMFTTTGYCTCEACSGGHSLTYSGTVPQARHTISANLDQFPLGTKLMIDDVIYTVEDMGSSVKENWIDIYYDTHEEAVSHGMTTQEVFRVIE